MKKTLLLLLVFLFFFPLVNGLKFCAAAQSWEWGRYGALSPADAWGIASDNAGNVYAAGFRWGVSLPPIRFGSFTIPPLPLTTLQQVIWAKYDAAGNVLWADGTKAGNSWLLNIASDLAGNLIIFGTFDSDTMKIGSFVLTNTHMPANQYYIAKVSPTGTVLWAHTDGSHVPTVYYGCLYDIIPSAGGVATDTAGNIYITSSFTSASITIGSSTLTNADVSGATNDVFIAKYSPAGTLLWVRKIGGTKDDMSLAITVSSTDSVYLCGAFYSPSVSVGSSVISDPYPIYSRAYIAKFSSSGTPLWAECAGGVNGAVSGGLAKDNYGNVYMTGTYCDASITFGTATITRTYPASVPNLAAFLIKYSASNSVAWTKTFGSPTKRVYGYTVAVSPCGDLWTCGRYIEPAVIDAGDTIQVVPGNDPIYLVAYDLGGTLKTWTQLGSGGDDVAGIACDEVGNVYVCSDFQPTWLYDHLNIGPDTIPFITPEVFYVAKFGKGSPDTTRTDTVICMPIAGMTLNAPAGYTTCYWDDGSVGATRVVTAPGKYYVIGTSCGTPVVVDTFTLIAIASGHSRKDTSVCMSAGAITLTAAAGYTSWVWNTGGTGQTLAVTGSGTWWVTGTNFCSVNTDTFHVVRIPDPLVNLGNDTGLCNGGSVVLGGAQAPGNTCLWSTGSTADTIRVSQTGLYWLTIKNGNCIATDTVQVGTLDAPSPFKLGPDTLLCVGDQLVINAPTGASAIWNDGSHGDKVTVTKAGTYWATISNACGAVSDTMKVDVEVCDLFFPDAFTPNSDGKNDIARVIGNLKHVKDFSLSIYNRFGQRVFHTDDVYSGWDGRFKGVPQDLGTFYFMINYSITGHKHMLKGDLQLIR